MNDIDMLRVADMMKAALLRELGDEVDLIFQFGSRLKGAAHKYSDLDLAYVPVHEMTWNCITVMVGDYLFDLFAMHWSKLEALADFRDVNTSLLLDNRIIYQRNDAVAERFRTLPARLKALQQPEAYPTMLRRAQEIFQATGYEYYLLRQQAAAGHRLACMHHSQRILATVLQCLTVCNQACTDTRKIAQVLALPKQPVGMAETVERITQSSDPEELLAACEVLLRTTRDLLLSEQRQVLRRETTFQAGFGGGYPELRGDLQRVMLGCERRDMFYLKIKLDSFYHELSLALAQAFTGIEYSGFNSLVEYEQDLAALGFPALMPYVEAGDFVGLHRQCLAFDQYLQKFLIERSVELNLFATPDELQAYLETRKPA